MFMIIFGIRRLRKAMGPVLLRCGNCGMSPLGLFRVSSWFSLFFIPIIPVGLKHYAVCPNCKQLVQLDDADLEEARAHANAIEAGGHDGTAGIPGRSATLEHAVNEWAADGHAQLAYSAPSESSSEVGLPDIPSPTEVSVGYGPEIRHDMNLWSAEQRRYLTRQLEAVQIRYFWRKQVLVTYPADQEKLEDLFTRLAAGRQDNEGTDVDQRQ